MPSILSISMDPCAVFVPIFSMLVTFLTNAVMTNAAVLQGYQYRQNAQWLGALFKHVKYPSYIHFKMFTHGVRWQCVFPFCHSRRTIKENRPAKFGVSLAKRSKSNGIIGVFFNILFKCHQFMSPMPDFRQIIIPKSLAKRLVAHLNNRQHTQILQARKCWQRWRRYFWHVPYGQRLFENKFFNICPAA